MLGGSLTFQMLQENKPQQASTFQASEWVIFANLPMANANSHDYLDSRWGEWIPLFDGRSAMSHDRKEEDLWLFCNLSTPSSHTGRLAFNPAWNFLINLCFRINPSHPREEEAGVCIPIGHWKPTAGHYPSSSHCLRPAARLAHWSRCCRHDSSVTPRKNKPSGENETTPVNAVYSTCLPFKVIQSIQGEYLQSVYKSNFALCEVSV